MWHKYTDFGDEPHQKCFYRKGIAINEVAPIFPQVKQVRKDIFMINDRYSWDEIWIIFDTYTSIDSINLTVVTNLFHDFYGDHMVVLLFVKGEHLSMVSPDDRDKFFHAI
jgi:hypothetical protein